MDMYVIEGGIPLRGTVYISGSKNACLPLMCAAMLADGPTVLENVPDLRDIRSMQQLLEHLNAKVVFKNGRMVIDPTNFDTDWVPYDMMRKMRASMYAFGPMISKRQKASVSKPGGCNIGTRPIDLHLKGFRALGVQLKERQGYIHATHEGMVGADFSLKGSNGPSVGATCNIIMAACFAEGLTVINDAAKEPEVQELCQFLNAMGAKISGIGTDKLEIAGIKKLQGTKWRVQPDRIEAATFAVAAAITKGDILLKAVRASEMKATLNLLEKWGAEITHHDDSSFQVAYPEDEFVHAQRVETGPYPALATDVQPLFCALFGLTGGKSEIQESIYFDRFMHVQELSRMGADMVHKDIRVQINGVEQYDGAPVMASDLRAGAALVLAALAAKGESEVRRIYHIERGYERFEQKIAALGGKINRVKETESETSKPVDWASLSDEDLIAEIETRG